METPAEIFGQLFAVRRSIRYHNRRRAFLDQVHSWATILSALSGSGAVMVFLSHAGGKWPVIFAAAVAILSAINLVFRPSRHAREHHDFARRYFALEKKIQCLRELTRENIEAIVSERLDIEADEPPPLKVLDSICHNELCRAMKIDRPHFASVKWYQRLFCQLFDICESNIRVEECK